MKTALMRPRRHTKPHARQLKHTKRKRMRLEIKAQFQESGLCHNLNFTASFPMVYVLRTLLTGAPLLTEQKD